MYFSFKRGYDIIFSLCYAKSKESKMTYVSFANRNVLFLSILKLVKPFGLYYMDDYTPKY